MQGHYVRGSWRHGGGDRCLVYFIPDVNIFFFFIGCDAEKLMPFVLQCIPERKMQTKNHQLSSMQRRLGNTLFSLPISLPYQTSLHSGETTKSPPDPPLAKNTASSKRKKTTSCEPSTSTPKRLNSRPSRRRPHIATPMNSTSQRSTPARGTAESTSHHGRRSARSGMTWSSY